MKTMNLRKRNKIPSEIKTGPEEVALGVEELVLFLDRKAIVVLYDDGINISAIACERLYDIPFYAAFHNFLPSDVTEESITMLSAVVLDSEELPYEIKEPDEELFIIYDEWDLSRHLDMELATADIEYTLKTYPGSDIEDFKVLLGRELPVTVVRAFINRVHVWREINGEQSIWES